MVAIVDLLPKKCGNSFPFRFITFSNGIATEKIEYFQEFTQVSQVQSKLKQQKLIGINFLC